MSALFTRFRGRNADCMTVPGARGLGDQRSPGQIGRWIQVRERDCSKVAGDA